MNSLADFFFVFFHNIKRPQIYIQARLLQSFFNCFLRQAPCLQYRHW